LSAHASVTETSVEYFLMLSFLQNKLTVP